MITGPTNFATDKCQDSGWRWSRHLQKQLRCKDLTFEQSVLDREEVGKLKEQLNTTSNGSDTAEQKEMHRGEKEKNKRGSQGKGSRSKSCRVDRIVGDTKAVKVEETNGHEAIGRTQ
ncbi:unnamed protein product [Peronospora effusa]|nr:unnamed protein product [Peronospora effusa]